MSENYLMLNGKRIELTEEQVKTLTAEEKKNPFERVKKYEKYFVIFNDGHVRQTNEENIGEDDDLYKAANYCTDKSMMKQRALHETLNRLLWRYSEEHGGDNEWDGFKNHWHIYKNANRTYFAIEGNSSMKRQGVVYFKDKEIAENAIEEIVKPFIDQHPEFVW